MTVRSGLAMTAAVLAWLAAACSNVPRTDAERAARGRELIGRMSTKLGSMSTFSVKTHETRDRVKSSGQLEHARLEREMVVRRPDRFYFRTTGDAENEGWYDGVGLTIAVHAEKVFAQARMPETMDRTFDAVHERYGLILPIADLLRASPEKALLADSTTGGWVEQTTVDGKSVEHLAFDDRGVHWEIWLPATGDPLPSRLLVDLPHSKRLRKLEVTFQDWNQAPAIAADRFDPSVPPDYEGIAMIQRASVLPHLAEAGGSAAADAVKK